jgi:hypothetical protein
MNPALLPCFHAVSPGSWCENSSSICARVRCSNVPACSWISWPWSMRQELEVWNQQFLWNANWGSVSSFVLIMLVFLLRRACSDWIKLWWPLTSYLCSCLSYLQFMWTNGCIKHVLSFMFCGVVAIAVNMPSMKQIAHFEVDSSNTLILFLWHQSHCLGLSVKMQWRFPKSQYIWLFRLGRHCASSCWNVPFIRLHQPNKRRFRLSLLHVIIVTDVDISLQN